MNFHPQAIERGWHGHSTSGLEEEIFKKIKAIYDAYHGPGYKGNAVAAVEEVLRAAGHPTPEPFACWIIEVCHVMVWYDPAGLDEEGRKRLSGLPLLPTEGGGG